MKPQTVQELFEKLKVDFPIGYPVILRMLKKDTLDGSCGFEVVHNIECIVIEVNTKLEPAFQRDVLVHEYTHAIILCRSFEHTSEWGKVYAELYRKEMEG